MMLSCPANAKTITKQAVLSVIHGKSCGSDQLVAYLLTTCDYEIEIDERRRCSTVEGRDLGGFDSRTRD